MFRLWIKYSKYVVTTITVEVKPRLNGVYAVTSNPIIRLVRKSVPPIVKVIFLITQKNYSIGMGGGVWLFSNDASSGTWHSFNQAGIPAVQTRVSALTDPDAIRADICCVV